jgi:hypothetical protein
MKMPSRYDYDQVIASFDKYFEPKQNILIDRKFKAFTTRYNIKHVTSSPYYPRSNGMVERAIQTVKLMLIKTKKSKGDLNLAIVDYNNTPKECGKTPSQMLMGRIYSCPQ